MTSRSALLALSLALAAVLGWQGLAQDARFSDPGQAGMALKEAERALAETQARAANLEREAQAASQAADRTAAEAAAVAARIQQSEAEIQVAQARIAVIDRQREALRLRIAARQEPVVRLTAALQLMARRPMVFSLMRSDSLRETVYLRAVLETMLPEVRRQTAGLRGEIMRGRQLQDSARALAGQLRASEQGLGERRAQLAALESRQRIASRAASGSASREADRALSLAEDTRDLGALMAQLQQDGVLRARLAALPGPVPRPVDPMAVPPVIDEAGPLAAPTGGFGWILPVTGRVVTGFAETAGTGPSRGITFAPAAAAQVVAPAAGRVAFAGPYRGYGRIVILEHDGGWSSLLTGLGALAVEVGDRVVQGSPVGSAGPGRPVVTVELRKDGQPVNPMAYLKG
ncbi:murein hydrolase activator EnvC family protein [Novosphingobium cyanobacteriorum]|uniref:Peptidoglycan DD-metalloendopeptidase family protein n=1 Tax=Novosphingobium cyanobacteriorum TaxID=3024215 RepID=A0ABT6CIM2_9SPHN|nr:peptidoglycan DD-metalloendopeptidase family protein [Novosphingobium cyanobacteriorum]MDF8332925.1 peptidoglycan DD-metalloendopeptidase family protein [Novosphingobium cyanobacteriorum]